MRKGMAAVISIMVLLLAFGTAFARGEKVQKEFKGFSVVSISTVSGNCIVQTHKSDKIEVELTYDVDPEDAFYYDFNERGKKLVIREEWRDSGSGHVEWLLTVPEGTEVRFSTASGDVSVTGPVGDFEASTASGEVELENVDGDIRVSTASGDVFVLDCNGRKKISTASGEIKIDDSGGDTRCSTASGDIEAEGLEGEISMSTASGEIEISKSRGIFGLSTASGSVEAKGIAIEGASDFSTASGSVRVVLSATSEYDLNLGTASGDVTLDYNGNPVKGYFEFEARKRRGRIVCPFSFDSEEEFERRHDTYVRKIFTKGGDSPEIILHTASGKVELIK